MFNPDGDRIIIRVEQRLRDESKDGHVNTIVKRSRSAGTSHAWYNDIEYLFARIRYLENTIAQLALKSCDMLENIETLLEGSEALTHAFMQPSEPPDTEEDI